MAEVVGLIASITAIVGIAGAATKLSSSLYRVAQSCGAASEDIERFAGEVDLFATTIGMAHYSLREHCQNHSNSSACSPALEYMRENAVLDQLTTQSERVVTHIKKVRPRIQSLGSRIDWVTRIKWLLRKSEIQSIRPEMENVKTCIHLAIDVVHFELAQTRDSRESRREMSVD
jgi:hypothetical protein